MAKTQQNRGTAALAEAVADTAAASAPLEPTPVNAPAVIDPNNPWGAMSGVGRENIGVDERVIPFVNVLQALSPELETIDGAKSGMILNRGTQQLYKGDEGVPFLPVERQQAYVEWVPRTKGGGFVARHRAEDAVVRDAKLRCAQNGGDPRFDTLWTGEPEESNELKQTFYLFGYALSKDEANQLHPEGAVLLSFVSTKIKVYKQFMNVVENLRGNPPLFALPVLLRTIKEKNAKGEFYNLRITPIESGKSYGETLLAPTNPLVAKGFELSKQIRAEQVKMGEEGSGPEDGEDKVPF